MDSSILIERAVIFSVYGSCLYFIGVINDDIAGLCEVIGIEEKLVFKVVGWGSWEP